MHDQIIFAAKTKRSEIVWSVSEFTSLIKELLEEAFQSVQIVGEISNAKLYPSGHWYFSLKDKDATISCVCFKGAASHLKFNLEDGLMVVAKGNLSVYPPRGNYQLVVTGLSPVGIGDWQLAFEQLKATLEKEGLLAPERKRPIPLLPRKIGVVTSLAGAALRDILTALKRRNEHVQIVISPAKVQGEGSKEEIAQAIENLQELEDIDVIIVGRGGGSIEDLWSFNTETVARAVANSRIPIISGVGHETDITICDLVADLRAPTPTAAAELVAKGQAELIERWHNLTDKMSLRMSAKISNYQLLLSKLDPIKAILTYKERLVNQRLRVEQFQNQIVSLTNGHLSKRNLKLAALEDKLLALSPQAIFQRGFSILRAADGKLITNSKQVQVNDELEGLLHDGKLSLKVLKVEEKR